MGKLDGKVAIITGSSTGIGRSTALLFGEEGACVTIHGRSEQSLNETFVLLKAHGVPEENILVVQGPIEEEKTCQDLISQTIEKFKKLDILVNNAGIGGNKGDKDYLSIDQYNYIFDVNVKSVVRMTQLAIPHLKETKGNIVNVSSVASTMAGPYPFYPMAKAALDHFGRCYSLILAEHGVRINTLNPGFVVTDFMKKLGLDDKQYEGFKQGCSPMVPMQRFGTPEEMAKTILFMATDATYMTGANIVADGGIVHFAPMPKMDN